MYVRNADTRCLDHVRCGLRLRILRCFCCALFHFVEIMPRKKLLNPSFFCDLMAFLTDVSILSFVRTGMVMVDFDVQLVMMCLMDLRMVGAVCAL